MRETLRQPHGQPPDASGVTLSEARSNHCRAIPFWQSLLVFGAPGLLIWAGVHWLVPAWVGAGVPLVFAWSFCVLVPTIGNAVVVLTIYAVREHPDWRTFQLRFRLQRPTVRQLALIPALAAVILLLNESLAWTIPWLQELPGFGLPPIVPEIFADPYEAVKLSGGSSTFLGVPLNREAAWLAPFWLIWVIGGVMGEELVWRGYLLPGQEARHGHWAWLVNGTLWNVPFHLYTLSNCLSDLPFYLILPFVVQRIGNTWVAIGVHALLASMAYVLILPGVFRG